MFLVLTNLNGFAGHSTPKSVTTLHCQCQDDDWSVKLL